MALLALTLLAVPSTVVAQTASPPVIEIEARPPLRPYTYAPVPTTAGAFPVGTRPANLALRAGHHRTSRMIAGSVIWCASYIGLIFWSRTLLGRSPNEEHEIGAVMLIPIVGAAIAAPMMAGTNLGNHEIAAMALVLSAIGQLGGTALAVSGVVGHLQSMRELRRAFSWTSLFVVPAAPGADVGLSLAGAF